MRVAKLPYVIALIIGFSVGCSKTPGAIPDSGTTAHSSGGSRAADGSAAGGAIYDIDSGADGSATRGGDSGVDESSAGGATKGVDSGIDSPATGGATNGGDTDVDGGSGGNGDSSEKPLGSLAGYCGARYDYRARCSSEIPPNYRPRSVDIANCVTEFGPLDVYRGDVFGAIQACLSTLECGRDVDECNIDGGLVVSSDPENHPLVTKCMAKVAVCKTGATPLHDDLCLMGLFLLESLKPDFNTCMDKPCDGVRACANPLFGR